MTQHSPSPAGDPTPQPAGTAPATTPSTRSTRTPPAGAAFSSTPPDSPTGRTAPATVTDGAGAFARFTVSRTAYLRNLDAEDLAAECIAIHHQNPPQRHADGSRTVSLRFPTLILAHYVSQPQAIAERIAEILNAHWSEETAHG